MRVESQSVATDTERIAAGMQILNLIAFLTVSHALRNFSMVIHTRNLKQ